MRKFELKRIADFILGNPPPEEKKPFAATSFTYSGSLSEKPVKKKKMGISDGSKDSYNKQMTDVTDHEDSSIEPKMSAWRKLFFLLSLNGGVIYVLMLSWWIPCRNPSCALLNKEWTFNLTDAVVTTNIETSDHHGSSSAILGYSTDAGSVLAAYHVANGTARWNVSSDVIYRHVFCNFRVPFDANSDSRPDGVLTAFEKMAAFDPEDGTILWNSTLTPPGETIHKVAPLGPPQRRVILGLSDTYLYLVNARSGTQERYMSLPCSWTVDIKIAGPWKTENGTTWVMVCEFGDSVEVYSVEEEDLLKTSKENDPQFRLLFSRQSDQGPIDVTGDVITSGDSLAVLWANVVVMVTLQGSPRDFTITMEKRFKNSVTSAVFGHFTRVDQLQMAVAMQSGANATVKILGEDVISNTGSRTIMALDKIAGKTGGKNKDTIVVESVHTGSTSTEGSTRSYFTMQYSSSNRQFVFHGVASASSVYASSLSFLSDGFSQLIVATRITGGGTRISRYVISSQRTENLCDKVKHTKTLTDAMPLD